MPPAIERWPSGGYFKWPTIARASSAVSTCGMTMPSAPPSSTRVASEYCRDGTRTTGVMPAVKAATEICTAVSSGMVPCSRSMNSQSKPQLAMAAATSTVRAWRSPMPRHSSPLFKRSRAGLRTVITVFPTDNVAQSESRSAPAPLVGEGWGGGCLFDSAKPIPPSRFARSARETTSPTRGEVTGARCQSCASSSLHPGPAVGHEPFLRQEAALVIHFFRAFHPIAEIDVAQSQPAGAGDVVEDHEGADRARVRVGLEEGIDHRQAVAEQVGQGDAEQRTGAVRGSPGLRILAAVFDDAGVDVAVLDHHRIVEHGHVGHAAVAVAGIEIVAEHRILLRGRHRHAHLGGEVRVVVEHAPHAAARAEILDDDPHRYASTAGLASRPVGDRLAAAETPVREQILELGSALPDPMGENPAPLPARPVRARPGR